jgi:predicted PurR-regulated permease PerM
MILEKEAKLTGQQVQDRSVRLLVALANTVLAVALIVAFVWATLKVIHAVLVFVLGILIAYALDPVVARLRALSRGRLSRGAAVFMALIAFTILLTLLVVIAAAPTSRQLHELSSQAPELRDRMDRLATQIDQWLVQRHLHFRVSTAIQQLSRVAHDRSQELATGALHAAGRVAETLVRALLSLLVAVYLLVYSPEMKRRLGEKLPRVYQQHFHELRRDLNQILGGFIRGQLLMAAAMGLSIGVGCAFLRLPFSILLGFFVAVTSLIPVIGAYIGAVPAVVLALLDPVNPGAKVTWVVVLFFVVNEAGSKILYPRLVGSATGLHEVVVLFVLLAGAEVGGVVGALLAVPITALVALLAAYTYRVWKQGGFPGSPEPAPTLVDAQPSSRDHPPPPFQLQPQPVEAVADRRPLPPELHPNQPMIQNAAPDRHSRRGSKKSTRPNGTRHP